MSPLTTWLDFLLVLGPRTSLNDVQITVESFNRQLLAKANLRVSLSFDVAQDVHQYLISKTEICASISLHHFQEVARTNILNALVDASNASYFAILDAGDVLAAGAVMHIHNALKVQHFTVDVLYSDEDKQGTSDLYTSAYFKPEWSPELLQSFNYFGRLTVLNSRIVKELGLFDDSLDEAAEWDLNLRISEVSQSIYRICRVLCHRASTSCQERPSPGSRNATFREAAIEKFWLNRGFSTKPQTQQDGTLHTILDIGLEPKVSIIIPTKDKLNLISTCIHGLLSETAYQNIEIIIVDTGSTEAGVSAFYDTLRGNLKIKFTSFSKTFNYSAACNLGATLASSELFLFLNNDTEVRHASWLSEMVQSALQPGVGIVGPQILFASGQLQAAGIFMGPFLAGLGYREAEAAHWGVFGSPQHPRNMLGTMGCCQMISREAFLRVNGFDEKYQIAHSDTAICLNIWLAGYRIVYNPYAKITHLEGSSRGASNPDADNQRLANEVFSLGIRYDPYFHPDLNAQTPVPQVRRENEWRDSESLAFNIAYHSGPKATDSLPFNIFDTGAVMQTTGLQRRQVLWTPEAAHKIHDVWSAARFCIDFYRSRVDVRQRFPYAFSGVVEGEFCQYLLGAEGAALGLTTIAQSHIRDLFATDISMAVQKKYLLDSSLRQQFPLGFIPAQANEFVAWLLVHGAKKHQLRNEEIWWFALKWHESPEAALALTYQTTPDWQRQCPNALTVFGVKNFADWLAQKYGLDTSWMQSDRWSFKLSVAAQLRQTYGVDKTWQDMFPQAMHRHEDALKLVHWLQSDAYCADPKVKTWLARLSPEDTAAELVRLGVNVLGPFCYPSGLRTSVECLCDGLEQNGVIVSKCDLPTDLTDEPGHTDMLGPELFDISILHVQPEPFFNHAYERADIAERAKKTYRIAYWYWELDTIPEAWLESAKLADELWAATEFIANAMRQSINKPVKTMFPGVRLKEYKPRLLNEFGLAHPQRFSFLFVFSMMSVMGRKNPIGLINAFKATFSHHEDVQLIIKTSYGYRNPAMLNRLREAAHAANIVIIDDVYSDDMTLSLMNACDAYISLHRSEGLGLTMAEAMLLGKPVIATRYSGNLDFMDDSNSLLVNYNLTKVGDECLPYIAEAYWADPSETHASLLMQKVYSNQMWAHKLGQKAMQDMQNKFSTFTTGKKITACLQSISKQYKNFSNSN